jgi:oligopeptide/dipeptide ABC transporter ATP-binding protein
MAHWTAVMYLGQIVEYARTEDLFANPLHPYTQALLSASLPADPEAIDKELLLGDEIPSPINPPSGCRLHPRCPFAMPICAMEEPASRNVLHVPNAIARGDHTVNCHLYGSSNNACDVSTAPARTEPVTRDA